MRRQALIKLRVTEAEKERWADAAERNGDSVSSWIRRTCQAALRSKPAPDGRSVNARKAEAEPPLCRFRDYGGCHKLGKNPCAVCRDAEAATSSS
jgi:hypothetical protein